MENVLAEKIVWDLGDLYSSPSDPQIEADTIAAPGEGRGIFFVQGEGGRAWSAGFAAGHPGPGRNKRDRSEAAGVCYLNFSTQTLNPAASALFQSGKELYSEIRRDTLFFELEWSKLEDSQARGLASDPALSKYSHYLTSLLRYKPHLLSEPEERILADKEPAGHRPGSPFSTRCSATSGSESKRGRSRKCSVNSTAASARSGNARQPS